MAEYFPGFVSVAWFGIVAPPRTPAAIAEKLSVAVVEMLRQPQVLSRLAALSAEPMGTTPAQMAAYMKEDAERWKKIIATAGVSLE